MKKLFAILMILIVLTIALTACSSNTDVSKSVGNDTNSSVALANDDGLDSALNELDDLERLEKE